MKIKIISDLHLEWEIKSYLGTKDAILVVAGDMAEARNALHREFFNYHSPLFRAILFVAGNHEYYKNSITNTNRSLEELADEFPNVHYLNNKVVKLDDLVFIGTTLWTDLNNGCEITALELKRGMNDYHLILNDTRILCPADTLNMFNDNIKFLKTECNKHKDDKVVVITHHGPSKQSIHPRYKYDKYLNGGYVSNLESFITNNPQIKLWMHGHTHSSHEYFINTTKVICNPKGYKNENPDFNPNYYVEL